MNLLKEPTPVEVPGRLFVLSAVILFVWHQCTNGNKIDTISLTLFAAAFLPWIGHFVEQIKIGNLEAKFPPRSGKAPTSIAKDKFDDLPRNGQRILATLWQYQKIHGKDWGFVVPPQNPAFIIFQTGVAELHDGKLIRFAPNGLISLSDEGFKFCQNNDYQISRYSDVYSNFRPIEG